MKNRKKLNEAVEQIIFTGPGIFIFVSVISTSFVYGLYLTFTNWDGLSNTIEFVGFDNYSRIIADPKFWASMGMTIKYVFFSLIIVNVLAFFIAYLLTSGIKGQTLFRLSFFSP
ncbi:MAG: sugar ABC transporter permease, partial [Clostridiaceae bacterium]|nr:sugar ABC transporter permease [Clostridiaceae bacterium]